MDAQNHKRRLMFGGSISHRGKSKRIGLESWWCFGQWCAGRRNNLAILSHKRFRSKRDHLTETDLTNMFTRVPSFSFDCVGTLATPYFLLTALVTCVFEAMRRFCSTCSVAKFIEALIFARHGCFVGVLFSKHCASSSLVASLKWCRRATRHPRVMKKCLMRVAVGCSFERCWGVVFGLLRALLGGIIAFHAKDDQYDKHMLKLGDTSICCRNW